MTKRKSSLVVVDTWSDLIEELFLDSYRETLGRYRIRRYPLRAPENGSNGSGGKRIENAILIGSLQALEGS